MMVGGDRGAMLGNERRENAEVREKKQMKRLWEDGNKSYYSF